jgi:hypothetical protein
MDYFPGMPSDTCFQYNVKFEHEEWFWQEDFIDGTIGRTYWISIAAIYEPAVFPLNNPWGWKTRPAHWMDDAVTFDFMGDPIPGAPIDPALVTPIEVDVESYDVSFELDTEPNWIKWEQYFTGIRQWPHYWDEFSMGLVDPPFPDPFIQRLAADDWLCRRKTPVTAVVWWGSYIGYRYEACAIPHPPMPQKPDYFLLNVWKDVPADPCVASSFSHPAEPIWEYRAREFDEVLVGYDKFPHAPDEPPYRQEPVFRYSVRLPRENWFYQADVNTVYWLSVVAVYDQNQPTHAWGWTNHEHVFNDNAVAGTKNVDGTWNWQELFDQTEADEDLSFILYTIGYPRCWDYDTQCHGDANGDGYVNTSDWPAFRDSFLKTYPDPMYNPCGDYNRDGTVNTSDWPEFRDNFLTWPPADCPIGGKWPPF